MMKKKISNPKTFYVTTPIYYVNDVPHLGTAYCTIAADVVARYRRLLGHEVFFLTGTDEHGEKIQEAAQKNNKSPKQFVDEVSQRFKIAWEKLNISYDHFIRTTDKVHTEEVQKLIAKAANHKPSPIELGFYENWYCVSDESFWTETQLNKGKCPSCGKDVKKVKEENYLFKLSLFEKELSHHIESCANDGGPEFIEPQGKKNEVVSFLKEGLKDLSISRTSFTWGIDFPDLNLGQKAKHVVYVWFDALFNYYTALKAYAKEHNLNESQFAEKFWNNAHVINLVGKDILRFHAVYWPCFLSSVDLPPPSTVFAHGWWTVEGQKMSKSLGNTIDPIEFSSQYGVDAFRLFVFREFSMGEDGDFSLKNFKERINADLANNYGNLISRSLNLISKNMNGQISKAKTTFSGKISKEPLLTEIIHMADQIRNEIYLQKTNSTGKKSSNTFESFSYLSILNEIFLFLNKLNKFVEESAPWSLAKDPAKHDEMKIVLNYTAEGIRLASVMLWPFIPDTAEKVLTQLGQTETLKLINLAKMKYDQRSQYKDFNSEYENVNLEKVLSFGFGSDATITTSSPLFMRLQ